MTSHSTNCVICGRGIEYSTKTALWQQQYRIVYSTPEGAFISGVSLRTSTDTEFHLPLSEAQRTDKEADETTRDNPLMQEPEHDGRHGYILHHECWILLQKIMGPHHIASPERLIEILDCQPWTIGGVPSASRLVWPHHYQTRASLMYQVDAPNHTWDDDVYRSFDGDRLSARESLMDSAEIRELLDSCLAGGLDPEHHRRPISRDCFGRVPWNVCEQIASALPTKSALDLRRASRTFVPLIRSDTFWKSRFLPGGEREYLYEVLDGSQGPYDLPLLYRRTAKVWKCSTLWQRELTSKFLKPLAQAMSSRLELSPHSADTNSTNYSWYSIRPRRSPGTQELPSGRAQHHEADLTNLNDLRCIGISTIGDYVTGFRCIKNDGREQIAGYICNEVLMDATRLQGIRIALRMSGICAIQTINISGEASRWIGRHEKYVTHTTWQGPASHERMQTLRVHFDGYKVIGLEVACPQNGRSPDFTAQSALWYKEPPPSYVNLNGESFVGPLPPTPSFPPFRTLHFGGAAGNRLKDVQGLRYKISEEAILSMQFIYKPPRAGAQQPQATLAGEDQQRYFEQTFLINGAEGEHIVAVYAAVERGRENDEVDRGVRAPLKGLKIVTNWGREDYSHRKWKFASWNLITYEISAGMTVTGFYGCYTYKGGIYSLGVLSEDVVL